MRSIVTFTLMRPAAGAYKAIAIDENRETAFRYWGDGLMRRGKHQARDKFVDAIVAEPYGRRAYVGLTQWGSRQGDAWAIRGFSRPTWTTTQDGKDYSNNRSQDVGQ